MVCVVGPPYLRSLPFRSFGPGRGLEPGSCHGSPRSRPTIVAMPSALVVTVVHHPDDSRIRGRQIPALLAAGWQVTYAAPFRGYEAVVDPAPGLTTVDLPRAAGRRRLAAARAARSLARRAGPRHDIVLVHDPELLVALVGLRLPLVWDVHEDPAAALAVKDWMPRPLRRSAAAGWRLAERLVERRYPLLLAEYAYQERFRGRHPVVPNTTIVPERPAPADLRQPRAVYLGNLTTSRGAQTLVEAARLVHAESEGAVLTDVIGPARDRSTRSLLEAAVSDGVLRWHGFVPAAQALALLDGAVVGLSLLRDLPNYRPSMPTKVVEYLAHGVPVVTTPLPLAAALVEACEGGVVVPFDDSRAAADAVLGLWRDPGRAAGMGRRGHALAVGRYDWRAGAADFVAVLEQLLTTGVRPGQGAT